MSTFDRDDLYVDHYYDIMADDRLREMTGSVTGKVEGYPYETLLRVALAVLLRAGFLLVQIGSVPVSNVNLILLQNVVDICAVTVVFTLVGYVAASSGDLHGLVGDGRWIGSDDADEEEAVAGWTAVVTASAIVTCGLAGRTHTLGYLAVACLLSGAVHPFLIHWAWTPKGWMSDNTLSGKKVSFRDYAGTGIVHAAGGLTGLIGCLSLGRRILRLKDLDDASLSPESPGSAFAGYLLILLGLMGLASPLKDSSRKVVVNDLLAASSCALLVVGFHFAVSREAFDHWTTMRCVQAAVSGIVTIAAGADLYSPLAAVGVSCAGGLAFYLVSRLVHRSALEDYCNISATHLASALLGIFLAPLCGSPPGQNPDSRALLLDLAWQVVCALTILLLVFLTMAPLFLVLKVLGLLRNRSEHLNSLRAAVALERGPPRSYMQRLFLQDAETRFLQPGRRGQGIGAGVPRERDEIALRERTAADEGGQGRARAEGAASMSDKVVQKERGKVKKVRQIYTIRRASRERVEDRGGTGESLDNVPGQNDPGKRSGHEGKIGSGPEGKLMLREEKNDDAGKEMSLVGTSFLEGLDPSDGLKGGDVEDVNLKGFHNPTDVSLSTATEDPNLKGFGNPTDVSLSTDAEVLNLTDVSLSTDPKDPNLKGFDNPADVSLSTDDKDLNLTDVSLSTDPKDPNLKGFNNPADVSLSADAKYANLKGFDNPTDVSLSTGAEDLNLTDILLSEDIEGPNLKGFNNPTNVSLNTNPKDPNLKRFNNPIDAADLNLRDVLLSTDLEDLNLTDVSLSTDPKHPNLEGFYNPTNVLLRTDLEGLNLKRLNPINDEDDGASKRSMDAGMLRKQPRYALHRTLKCTNLHLQESTRKIVHHEVNVEVLVKPRQEEFSSSDSEEGGKVEDSTST